MCNPSWQNKLRQAIAGLNKQPADLRIAIVGIGNELRGDDIAGAEVAEMLQPVAQKSNRLLALNVGSAPENFTGPLRRFQPDLVLLVDAADMGLAPGAIDLLSWQDAEGVSASTHSLPLHVFAGYIAKELECAVMLLGIQPIDTSLGAPLSEPVHQALHQLEHDLPHLLQF